MSSHRLTLCLTIQHAFLFVIHLRKWEIIRSEKHFLHSIFICKNNFFIGLTPLKYIYMIIKSFAKSSTTAKNKLIRIIPSKENGYFIKLALDNYQARRATDTGVPFRERKYIFYGHHKHGKTFSESLRCQQC